MAIHIAHITLPGLLCQSFLSRRVHSKQTPAYPIAWGKTMDISERESQAIFITQTDQYQAVMLSEASGPGLRFYHVVSVRFFAALRMTSYICSCQS